ncbi:MAG: hypothetical protein ACFFD1_08280 [Candidatus Thorarchaeota archaeon]
MKIPYIHFKYSEQRLKRTSCNGIIQTYILFATVLFVFGIIFFNNRYPILSYNFLAIPQGNYLPLFIAIVIFFVLPQSVILLLSYSQWMSREEYLQSVLIK